MNQTKEKLALNMKGYLRGLSSRRSSKVVTADDAQNYLSAQGVSRSVRTRLSLINSVLRRPFFKNVGSTASSREPARYRQITEWRAR